jgi:hypothetical protein
MGIKNNTGMAIYIDNTFIPVNSIPKEAIEIDCEEIGLSRDMTYGFRFDIDNWIYELLGEKKKVVLHDPTEGYFLQINSYAKFYKLKNIIYYKGGFSIT